MPSLTDCSCLTCNINCSCRCEDSDHEAISLSKAVFDGSNLSKNSFLALSRCILCSSRWICSSLSLRAFFSFSRSSVVDGTLAALTADELSNAKFMGRVFTLASAPSSTRDGTPWIFCFVSFLHTVQARAWFAGTFKMPRVNISIRHC